MSDPRLDPVLRVALDSYTVPSLSDGFADRVVAAATSAAKPLPVSAAPRRDRRGSWVRGHRVIIGAVAFGLMSAAAAATAIFPEAVRTIPVIGTLIAHVTPTKHVPKPKKALVRKPEIKAPVVAQPPVLAIAPAVEAPRFPVPVRREIRREFVAEKIATRLEQRAERRAELGLPPRPPRPAQIVRVLRRLPPGDRAAVIQRVREIRREQRGESPMMREPETGLSMNQPAPAPAMDLPPRTIENDLTPPLPEPQARDTAENPERVKQIRRLRAFREFQQRRREMRRQRMQQ